MLDPTPAAATLPPYPADLHNPYLTEDFVRPNPTHKPRAQPGVLGAAKKLLGF